MRLRAQDGMAFVIALLAIATPALAQNRPLSATDSALIGRILVAEDRRDSTDRALDEGARHADARVARSRCERAAESLTGCSRGAIHSLPCPRPPPGPSRRGAFVFARSLISEMTAARYAPRSPTAPGQSVFAPRISRRNLRERRRARHSSPIMDRRAARRRLTPDAGAVSWHGAAHAEVALARVRPAAARSRLSKLASHRQWQARMYAARAAAVLADTSTLRALARDTTDGVREAAIDALGKLTGHADDEIFVAALSANGAQVVRAAAIALKDSPRADVRPAASAAFDRWVARQNASAHDARVAFSLPRAGRPATTVRLPCASSFRQTQWHSPSAPSVACA